MKTHLLALLLLCRILCFSQEGNEVKRYALDGSAFYGSILLHNTDISHLIREHPTGFIMALNRKTYGEQDWERIYNYPDLGLSFVYQDFRNETLGENFGLYAHYNFYFFKRMLQLRIGQGIFHTQILHSGTSGNLGIAIHRHITADTGRPPDDACSFDTQNVACAVACACGYGIPELFGLYLQSCRMRL